MSAQLLTGPQICDRLGISRWTWRRWVRTGVAPEPVPNLPGWPRWKADAIERFEAGIRKAEPGRRSYFTSAARARSLQCA